MLNFGWTACHPIKYEADFYWARTLVRLGPSTVCSGSLLSGSFYARMSHITCHSKTFHWKCQVLKLGPQHSHNYVVIPNYQKLYQTCRYICMHRTSAKKKRRIGHLVHIIRCLKKTKTKSNTTPQLCGLRKPTENQNASGRRNVYKSTHHLRQFHFPSWNSRRHTYSMLPCESPRQALTRHLICLASARLLHQIGFSSSPGIFNIVICLMQHS